MRLLGADIVAGDDDQPSALGEPRERRRKMAECLGRLSLPERVLACPATAGWRGYLTNLLPAGGNG
jgi:hypothetical protein